MCAVNSRVGVQATGRSALNTVGGKASIATSSPSVSIRSSSRSRNQPRTTGRPLGSPLGNRLSSGWSRISTLPMKGGGKVSVGVTGTKSSGSGR